MVGWIKETSLLPGTMLDFLVEIGSHTETARFEGSQVKPARVWE